jgi:DNA ligase (NAD+)
MKPLNTYRGNKLDGKTFVFTGTLESFSRSEAAKMVESLGGKSSSSVTSKTDFVVVGQDAGSKLAKANKIGLKIINEDEFNQMLNGQEPTF